EPRPQRVILEQFWRARVKFPKRRRIGLLARGAQTLVPVGSDRGLDVHRRSSRTQGNVIDYNLCTCRSQSRFPVCAELNGDAGWQGLVAFDKARINPLRLAHHFDPVEALEDLFPDDLQL